MRLIDDERGFPLGAGVPVDLAAGPGGACTPDPGDEPGEPHIVQRWRVRIVGWGEAKPTLRGCLLARPVAYRGPSVDTGTAVGRWVELVGAARDLIDAADGHGSDPVALSKDVFGGEVGVERWQRTQELVAGHVVDVGAPGAAVADPMAAFTL